MDHNGNLIFIGTVASGKSSFIAALWHVIESGELDGSLQYHVLPAEREYLNNLRTAWLDCRPVDRTISQSVHEITLQLKKQNSRESDLFFPDLAGELFESIFANRDAPKSFVERLRSTSDIVLFINPDKLKKPDLISDANDALSAIDGDPVDAESIPGNELGTEEHWDPKHAPTQVVLVDLLQVILEYVENPKIAVVISAWDVILSMPKKHRVLPHEWLSTNLPLFKQFMNANSGRLQFKVFGVSAQGADYSQSGKNQLQTYVRQSDRIKVQLDSGDIVHDISEPIKWILNG